MKRLNMNTLAMIGLAMATTGLADLSPRPRQKKKHDPEKIAKAEAKRQMRSDKLKKREAQKS